MQTQKNADAVTYCEPVVWNDSDITLSPVVINNNPYFIAVEVCKLLDLSNPTDRLKSLDDDEKLTYPIDRAGQQRVVNLVNESGFYHLIFLSRKPQAAAIRKWVTSEVLPALRRTGRYEILPTRHSLRHPRRGEPITAEILHLLWLIGESLHQGDQIEIAMELGVTRQTVSRVLNGGQRSSRILMALYKRAQANREADRLYHAPREMAQRLLGENVPVPSPRRLPAVHLNCGRGAALGNQNARKHQSDR
jgi:prophage antirepressor-like protein